ncbi:M20 family metallopeptidase [Olsenella sp. Marseille-P4559]|uniref:M20 family metallopeptidase n=1 Tax=Olsenella sp. Marseille-P4559 TaxID=2364795 RepID=UPI0010303777|nr:M20/M25/M40 family metallo-hydrolase [Olsenella sp. Marseille-P4559]
MDVRETCTALEFARGVREEALDLLRAIGRIGAPTGDEGRRAAFVAAWLREQGAADVAIDEARNVVCVLGDRSAPGRAVFSAHTDIVFPDTGELPLTEDEENMYAPGIGDDTACLVTLLMATKWFLMNRPQLDTCVVVVANSGEEGLGNLKGTKQLMREATAPVTELTALDAHFPEVVTEAVGSLRYRISVHTQGGHSWKDWGVPNAIERLSRIVCALYDLPRPTDARTTCNIGLIEGGTTVNSIASEASCLCEFRSTSEACLQEMDEKLRGLVAQADARDDMEVHLGVIGRRPAAGDVSESAERRLTRRCDQAIQAVLGMRARHVSSSTDANVPLSLGVPAVCVGTIDGGLPHTREEWIRKASLEQGVAVALLLMMAHVVKDA